MDPQSEENLPNTQIFREDSAFHGSEKEEGLVQFQVSHEGAPECVQDFE